MLGKIRKKLLEQVDDVDFQSAKLTCPICDRPIPDSQKDAHHLIPKSKGGRHTQYLHRICHRQIHALFSETELANYLNTAEALKENEALQKFIRWVKTKPDSYYKRTSKSERLKSNIN
jgi:5-methylcytosine-specific restriction endonuclease McrA